MPRFQILPIAGLLLIVVSTVISAPNRQDDDRKLDEELPNVEGFQNDSSAPTADVSTKTVSSDGPRTLIMYGLLSWLLGVVKAMIRPARNMYISMAPEISAFRCLSESREFENVMGFSGSDFEGYVYETPRTSDGRRPLIDGSPDDRISSGQGFSNEVYDSNFHLNDSPNFPENDSFYDLTESSTSHNIQHRTDEVLKRFPRFIDQFASLLKEGQAMNCIMPYMRERVMRWIDS